MSLHEKWFYEKPTLMSVFYHAFGMSRKTYGYACYKEISE